MTEVLVLDREELACVECGVELKGYGKTGLCGRCVGRQNIVKGHRINRENGWEAQQQGLAKGRETNRANGWQNLAKANEINRANGWQNLAKARVKSREAQRANGYQSLAKGNETMRATYQTCLLYTSPSPRDS